MQGPYHFNIIVTNIGKSLWYEPYYEPDKIILIKRILSSMDWTGFERLGLNAANPNGSATTRQEKSNR